MVNIWVTLRCDDCGRQLFEERAERIALNPSGWAAWCVGRVVEHKRDCPAARPPIGSDDPTPTPERPAEKVDPAEHARLIRAGFRHGGSSVHCAACGYGWSYYSGKPYRSGKRCPGCRVRGQVCAYPNGHGGEHVPRPEARA